MFSSDGLKAGGRCGEEVLMPDIIEDHSLWILSEKNVSNDWGKEFWVKDEENGGLTILCSMLLIVFQSFNLAGWGGQEG